MDKDWNVYLLISNSNKKTYIGASNNPKKRLRCHNGELVGGAKATKKDRPWEHVFIISGLDKISALQLEWRLKKKKSTKSNKLISFSGINNKIKNLYEVLNLDKWTSKSKDLSSFNLLITWFKPEYKLDLELPNNIKQTNFINSLVINEINSGEPESNQ